MSDKAMPIPTAPDTESMFRNMCVRLRACVVKHNLGLGGEMLDELVVNELDRMKAAAQAPSISIEISKRHPTLEARERKVEALNEYVELRNEIGELEANCETNCSCDADQFHRCSLCEDLAAKESHHRGLLNLWGDSWAVMLSEATLPFQAWCECGHISGQHGAKYPHRCAVDGGCEKECYGFRVKQAAERTQAPSTDYPAILERERTAVSEGVTAIKAVLSGRDWLTEGRGPYEWNDDRWHSEFAAACQEIVEALKPLERIAGDLSNCPKTQAEVEAARAGTQAPSEQSAAEFWPRWIGPNDFQTVSLVTMFAFAEAYKSLAGTQAQAAQWISVHERLPEIGPEVLIIEEVKHHLEGYPPTRVTFLGYRNAGGWFTDDDESLGDAVTHWMPLPVAPVAALEEKP